MEIKMIYCCGARLECPEFTNTCPRCDSDYNWLGDRLRPRSEWDEELGYGLDDY